MTSSGQSDLELALAESPDPPAAREALARIRESAEAKGVSLPASDGLAVVVPLLGCRVIASRLVSSPRLASWLVRTRFLEEERPAFSYFSQLRARTSLLTEPEELDRVLRRFRNREMSRIALRDLSRRASLTSVVRELSTLADGLAAAALEFWDMRLAARYGEPMGARFCVVAMGKHGAQELNYSSDIDVLFVFEDESLRAQAIAVSQAIIRSLSAITADGFCFRVDANLRPYGRDGPLAQNIDEMERYYERAGQTWERAALIKARPCAGGVELGDELLGRLRGFVFRKALDIGAVKAVAAMKRRIDRDRSHSPQDNVKLGYGGIREIEFFVQALQLLRGGRQPGLRERGTLDALDALLYAGVIPAQERAALAEAYVFLRDVEHRLQLPDDRQTQDLPAADELGARRFLARTMGFADTAPFEATLARHRRAVHELFLGLLATAAEERTTSREVDIVLEPHVPDEDCVAALVTLGFRDSEAAFLIIRQLQRNDHGAFGARGREMHPALAEHMLEELAQSPDPDLALVQLAGLFEQRWQAASVTEMLSRQPALRRVLMLLFGSSESLTRDLKLRPELLDLLPATDSGESPAAGSLEKAVQDRIIAETGIEERLAALRVLRRYETLRVALQDLAHRLRPAEVGARLTELADAVVRAVYAIAREEMAERYGEPAHAHFAVLGFGSLGGEEMDYESDLDLVFVYDGAGSTSGGSRGVVESNEWAARISQRLLHHLTQPGPEGVLYRVDARLRPSGTAGSLVASLPAFARYHGVFEGEEPRGAALWERQALLRARPIAGDGALSDAISADVLDVVAAMPVPADTAAQIADMRYRLDANGPAGAVYPKKSPGGLLDVEFLMQFLEMRHGRRIPSTRRALDAARDDRWLRSETIDDLSRGFELLRRVESRLRMRYSRADVFVPSEGAGLEFIARQLGDIGAGAGRRLWRNMTRALERNREIFREVVR